MSRIVPLRLVLSKLRPSCKDKLVGLLLPLGVMSLVLFGGNAGKCLCQRFKLCLQAGSPLLYSLSSCRRCCCSSEDDIVKLEEGCSISLECLESFESLGPLLPTSPSEATIVPTSVMLPHGLKCSRLYAPKEGSAIPPLCIVEVPWSHTCSSTRSGLPSTSCST